MNGMIDAIRLGARRGWHETVLSVKSSQDQTFYVLLAVASVVFMYFQRNNVVEGTSLTMPQAIYPTMIAVLVAFALVVGPAQQLAMEREDGTVLRMTSAPRGTAAYVVGQLVFHVTSLVPLLVIVSVPSMLLFSTGSQRGWTGWAAGLAVMVVGTLALLPLGVLIGCLVPDIRRIMTWGMLPFGGMVVLSGVFMPVSQLWGWLQPVAQALPLYWFGHGMRFAFLPDEAAGGELHGQWQVPLAMGVLVAWAVVGWVVALIAIRRMARGQSGASVVFARDNSQQWVR